MPRRSNNDSSSIFTFIILMVFAVSAVGSAYFTYRYFGGVQAKPLLNGPKYDAGQFIVDLLPESTHNSSRILKTNISVQTNGGPVVRALRARSVEVRDAINRILRNRSPKMLAGKNGMDALEDDIVNSLEAILGANSISAVYFTEWVMQ